MSETLARKPGRPRDPTIDRKVLDATRELLVEKGLEAATVQAIAERSGVHASAIYRRWSSRLDILEEAVFPGPTIVLVEPTGDLKRDIRRFVRTYLAVFGAPAARAAVPGLLASYQSNGRSDVPEKWMVVSARPQFAEILRRARSGVDPKVDAEDVFDVLLGAVLARALVPTVIERRRPVERLVELTLRMLRPGPEEQS
jgi:AcrR family transcriptional regulator